MNRRNFLAIATAGAIALASLSAMPVEVSRTGIVRRHSYKRARWYKRRAARRNPLPRLLKRLYSDIRRDLTPVFTPLIAQLSRSASGKRWGGQNLYYDVVAI